MANNGLTRRANCKWLFEFFAASTHHPGKFWSESFYMFRFSLDKTTWNEQWKVGIQYPSFFEAIIHKSLNILPDSIAIRSDDHAASYRRIICQRSFTHNLVIPLGKIIILIGYILDKSFFVNHIS